MNHLHPVSGVSDVVTDLASTIVKGILRKETRNTLEIRYDVESEKAKLNPPLSNRTRIESTAEQQSYRI